MPPMYIVVPPDPDWPRRFAALADAIRSALGDRARRIDHIGSTAVPGLAAKDVIDIQVTVADLAVEVGAPLTALGYRELPAITRDHLPPGGDPEPSAWAKRIFVLGEDPRRANLHLRVDGRPNQRYALLFRDYLRATPDAANAYGQAKQALARHLGHDADAYYDVKDPVCDLIARAAEAWALSTRWRPPPADR